MIIQSVTDCIEKRTEYSVEHRIIWPDQSLHWVACKGDVLRDDSGKAVRMLGTVMEITEHKRAEEALHASEERFRSLVSNIPGAVYRCACDPDWTMEFISEAIEDLCGYPSSDFYANRLRTYASVIHPDDRATVEREIFGAVNARRPFALEYRLLHADGSVRCVHEQGQGAFDSGGQVRWLDGVIFDVTERNRTKEALQETTERFSAAFGYAAIGMAIVATDGRFLQVNESLCRILGYSGQELLAMTFHAITHPDDLALNLAQRDHMLTGDVPTFHMEKRYIHKLGHIVWTLLSIALVRDSHGQPAYFISQVQDITERKRAESQLRALSQRLELIREEERARIARELHDELGVGLTCHKIDLSRLSTMMGDAIGSERRRAEDCKKGRRKLDEKIRSMMAQVDTTITAVQRIVTELRPGILDDLGLVAAIEWQTQDFQRRTGIPCLFVPNEEDRHMDPERATVIFRIFQEALTNVARHAQATAVTIRLEEQAGGLVLEVQDNGQGIPDEKIFDVHSLGLLGMRERAGLFGGSLTIKGCPGKGTAVTLCLPISGESLDTRNASC
jgi:PAS domain S-box-containing protein